jgi:hypothetical protein
VAADRGQRRNGQPANTIEEERRATGDRLYGGSLGDRVRNWRKICGLATWKAMLPDMSSHQGRSLTGAGDTGPTVEIGFNGVTPSKATSDQFYLIFVNKSTSDFMGGRTSYPRYASTTSPMRRKDY